MLLPDQLQTMGVPASSGYPANEHIQNRRQAGRYYARALYCHVDKLMSHAHTALPGNFCKLKDAAKQSLAHRLTIVTTNKKADLCQRSVILLCSKCLYILPNLIMRVKQALLHRPPDACQFLEQRFCEQLRKSASQSSILQYSQHASARNHDQSINRLI